MSEQQAPHADAVPVPDSEAGAARVKSKAGLLAQSLPENEHSDRFKPGTAMADLREWLRPHEPRS